MEEIQSLQQSYYHDVDIDPENRPIILIDKKQYYLGDLKNNKVIGINAYIIGATNQNFDILCKNIDVQELMFYDMKVKDLKPLTHLKKLKHLAIRWNTKVTDINVLSMLKYLETLMFENTPKIDSIAPLQSLSFLSYLEFSGGIWNKNTVKTLKPLSALKSLRKIVLRNIKIHDDSLKPLVNCTSLEEIIISNQFKTEEFAYLHSKLKNTKCDYFAPFIKLKKPINDKNTMVIGRRKPFLNSKTDKEKLQKYIDSYNLLLLQNV